MTVEVSKFQSYAVLVNNEVSVSKFVAYAVLTSGTLPVFASGLLGTLTLTAPAGDASPVLGVSASGDIGTITFSAIEGFGAPLAFALGDLATITLTSPEGAATIGAIEFVTQMGLTVIGLPESDALTTQMGLTVVGEVDTQPRVTQMGLLVIASTGTIPRQPSFINLTDRGREELLNLRTVNMYAERTPDGPTDWALFPRPGLKYLNARGAGPVRALFSWIGFRVIVSGTGVYIDGDLVGSVPGPEEGFVFYAVSNDFIVLNIGKRVYIATLDGVVLADNVLLRNVRCVAFLSGRFVYVEDDNSGIYRYSDLNDPNVLDGLAFASAESNPDPIDSVVAYNGQLVFFNQRSVEWHFPTPNATNPFQRSQGRTYDKGSISPKGTTLVNNMLFFPGEDKVVYQAAESPRPVSDSAVGKALTKLTTDEMRQITAYQAYYDQHFWYVMNLPGQGTWAYDTTTSRWYEWKSFLKNRFQVSCSDGEIYGDYETSSLYQFEGRTYEDDEKPMERIISTFLPQRSGYVRQFNLILMCQKAVGKLTGRALAPVVEMRFSDDLGKSWSIWSEQRLAVMGQTGKEWTTEWTGLGSVSSPGRLFEFRCTDPVNFIPYQVKFNEVQGR